MSDASFRTQVGPHELTVLAGATPITRALEADLAGATRRVLVETYIVREDRMGRRFGDGLAAAAARGADVRLVYDPLGSKTTPSSYFDGLRRHGVDVRAYRGARAFRARRVFAPRDHSRVFVFDDVAWTGGIAIADFWLPIEDGGEGWHDVCLRTVGPVVEDFVRLFETRWQEAAGNLRPRDLDTGDAYPALRLVSDSAASPRTLYRLHQEAFDRARARIWLENAYFFPTPGLRAALAAAAARGVDVRLLLPERSDLPIIRRAARAEYLDYLAAGLRIWEYRGTVMHSKLALVDDDWCAVGTFNINPTSVRVANELSLVVTDRGLVRGLAQHVLDDLAHSVPIAADGVRRRPFLQRELDHLARAAMSVYDLLVGSPRT